MRFIYALFLLVLCSNLFSQSNLSGTVTGSSNSPVLSATITLKTNDQIQKSTQTDSSGRFSFGRLKTGRYSLTVTHVEYESYELNFPLNGDTALMIPVKESGKLLTEVVVGANKQAIEKTTGKLVYNITSSVTASGSDAVEAISQIPGIRVGNNEITMVGRGLVKVMINGRLVQLSDDDLTRYLKSISANEISRIEVISNPSAKYESDGNAGLINIITTHSKKQGYSGNIQLSAQRAAPGQSPIYGIHSFGELSGGGNLAYNSEKWSAYGNLNVAQTKLLEGFKTNVFYPRQTWMQSDTGVYKYKSYNAIAGVDYKISPGTTIGASYIFSRVKMNGSDHVNNPIYNVQGQLDSTLKTYATYYPLALSNSANAFAQIRLDSSGKQLLINADLVSYYRTDESDFEGTSYDAEGAHKPESEARYFDNNKQVIGIYTLKADVDFPTLFAKYTFGTKLSFINNYSNAFYYNKVNGDELVYNKDLSNEFRYLENTQAVYGSMEKTLNKWRLSGGLRAELTQTNGYSFTLDQTTINNYFKVFPSFLASYQANSDNVYSFSVGRRTNRPTFWNLNPFKSLYTNYSYGEGNPYLQPEYNTNMELSHSFRSIVASSLFLNVTENGFNNVTMAFPDTNLVYTIPLNFIRLYKVGISENVSLKISNWWESNQLITVYHTNARFSISNIEDIKGFGGYVSTNNSFFLNSSRTLAAALNLWVQFPEIDRIGRSNTYSKLDIGIKATSPDKKWDFALNVNDLFRSSASTITTTVNGISQKFAHFQVNRYLQLSLNYKFGASRSSGNRTRGNEEEKRRI